MDDRPRDLEKRLRAALTLDIEAHRLDAGIDMSAEAITRRILDLAEMSSLCLELTAIDSAPAAERGTTS